MKQGVWAILAFIAIVVGASMLKSGDERTPPIFQNITYQEAQKSASEQHKLLIVKATASWCGPCKKMNATTWRDEKVTSWITEHGLAVELDVDKEQGIATDLHIDAIPTMIAFRDGQEVSRIVGYQTTRELLDFLQAADAGQ